ncbi:MAG TPA: hypothetical protein VFA39_15485 [Steroidobacteraceae bacterium]|nr:hypothetical protein [Steroidobacteraceae bacterium]
MPIEKDLTRIAVALEAIAKVLVPVEVTKGTSVKGKAKAAPVSKEEQETATEAEVEANADSTETAAPEQTPGPAVTAGSSTSETPPSQMAPATTATAPASSTPSQTSAPAPVPTEDQVKALLQAYRTHKFGSAQDATSKVQDELEKLVGVRLVKLIKPEDRQKVLDAFKVAA